MKVYARYFEENELGFRRNTILQFGNSWDLIGSIILINPGSATPLNTPIQPEVLEKLLAMTQSNDPDSWKEFSIDPTMGQIEKLFRGQFIGQDKPLNGVIQLFNLFNLRNANLSRALELFKTTSNPNIVSIEEDIAKIEDKPVYFGWGNAGKYQLKDIAEKVFKRVPKQAYLNNFENTTFYHPRYLQMAHKRDGNVIKILHDFYNQDQEYVWDGVIEEARHINAGTVREKFHKLLSSQIDTNGITIKSDASTTRIFFQDNENNELEFIVTINEGGYTAIRFNPKKPLLKDNSIDYIIGCSHGFDTIEDFKNDKNGKWFCRQSFKNFHIEEDELANQLIEICRDFLSLKKA